MITVDGSRRVINDGSITVSDGLITQVAASHELDEQHARVEIDGHHKIVMPGLVNPHLHFSYSLARCCADDLDFLDWLGVVFRVEDGYTDEEWRLTSLLSMVEAIKSGTTCVADTNIFGQIQQVAGAVEETGVRAVLGRSITQPAAEDLARTPWLIRSFDEERVSVEAAIRDYERWDREADGRIRVRFSPRRWPACSKQVYEQLARLGQQMGVGSLIHHTEARQWHDFVIEQYGKPPTMMLHDFGILGPTTLLENASILGRDEISLLAETGTPLNYLPTANMKNSLGVVNITRVLDAGVTVSLGTSGGLINNVNDLLQEMKTLALQQRMLNDRPHALPAETLVEMATIGGAKALNLDTEIGSLEPGKRADIIVLDAFQPHMLPLHDPVSAVVYCATGADVETVIIDGRIIMRDRQVTTLDEVGLLERTIVEGTTAIRRFGLGRESQRPNNGVGSSADSEHRLDAARTAHSVMPADQDAKAECGERD